MLGRQGWGKHGRAYLLEEREGVVGTACEVRWGKVNTETEFLEGELTSSFLSGMSLSFFAEEVSWETLL